MKVFNCDTWHELESFDTDPGNFVGLAIGPESDEAVVRVGSLVLQAGRPLPLRSGGSGYHLERFTHALTGITAIRRLQVVAFECLEELSACPRANGRYSAQKAFTVGAGYDRLIVVPFVGRRQARFQLVTDGQTATVSYRVYGITFNLGTRDVRASMLVEQTSQQPDAANTLAFYMGGTNEAECWAALAVDVAVASDSTISIDVETIGELGER